MNSFYSTVIKLIKSALTGEKYVIDSEISPSALTLFAAMHQVSALIYKGLCNCGVYTEEYSKLADNSIYAFQLSEYQEYDIKLLKNEFKKNGIDYLPLKGIVLKELYPQKEFREMSDVDILIRCSQYENLILPVMKTLGYTFISESDHEIKWEKDYMIVELHKKPVQNSYKRYHGYFGDGWALAEKTSSDSKEFRYSDENFFLYMLTHFAKHYAYSGVGIKYMIDFYIYLKSKPSLDFDYINSKADILFLGDFLKNTEYLLGVWFDGKPETNITIPMTDYLFSGGVYGRKVDRIVSNNVKHTGNMGNQTKSRIFYIRELLFPSYVSMTGRYEVLKRMPVMLPVFWFYRIISTPFRKRRQRRNVLRDLKSLNNKNIERYRKAIEASGLDITD